MTNSVNHSPTSRFPRVDSAQELHGDAILAKPFAHRSKLEDLVSAKSTAYVPLPVKNFPLPLPKAPRMPIASDVRDELAGIGATTADALGELQTAEQNALRNTRYVISAAPNTPWDAAAGNAATNLELSAQRLTLQCTSADTVNLSRGGGSAALACDSDAHTKISLDQDITATGIGIAQTVDTTSAGSDVLKGELFGTDQVRGISLANTWTTGGDTRVGGSIAAVIVGGSRLQPMMWDDGVANSGGRVLAKWETQLMPIIACDVGASWVHLGASVRASAFKSHQNVYEVYVSPQEINAAMVNSHGLAHWVASGMQTLGWKEAPVGLPSLRKVLEERHANHLGIGESVRMVRTGNISGGVAVSAYGSRLGLYGSYTGETELTVARVDENHLDVTIAPKRIKTFSANFDALIAAEIFTTGSLATGLSRGFRVDLRESASREALGKLFDSGICPGCDHAPTRLNAYAAIDMAQQVRHGALPDGTRSLYMQRAEQVEARWGLGMPKPFFLTGRIAGMGLEGKVFDGIQVTTDGSASLTTKTLGLGKKRDLWAAGSTYKDLTAGVRRLDLFDESGRPESRFDGLDVKLVKGLTRVVGQARAKLTRKVAKLLGTDIPTPKQKGEAQTYAVTMERLFTHNDLARVAACTHIERLRAAFQSGVPIKALTTLTERLQKLKADSDITSLAFALNTAAEVQAFLVAHGQRGFAAVHAMTRGSIEDVDVGVESSAFDKPVKKSFALQLEYGISQDARTLKRGVREAARVKEEVKRGVSNLQDDPILKKLNSENHGAKVTALKAVHTETEQFSERLKGRLDSLLAAKGSLVLQGA